MESPWETQLVGQSHIFLYRERREYLDALNKICAGLESARVAPVKARRRMETRGQRWRRCDGHLRYRYLLPLNAVGSADG
jgi:hypothetical protein